MSDKKLIIYHANCPDGFCAAWITRNFWRTADMEFVPAQYGDAPPDCTDKEVYILDFSYPLATLEQVAAAAEYVTIIDHHQTAAEFLPKFHDGHVVFSLVKSGARLTWEYLRWAETVPWLVQYVEDRDLWRFDLPRSREVTAVIRSYPLDFATWDRLAYSQPEFLVEAGAAILRREEQIIAEHVARARMVELAGYRVPCVNATTMYSDVADELAKGHPFALSYFDRLNEHGKLVRQFSLRSEEEGVDVSEVAKRFGGGGHKHAAGFTIASCANSDFVEED